MCYGLRLTEKTHSIYGTLHTCSEFPKKRQLEMKMMLLAATAAMMVQAAQPDVFRFRDQTALAAFSGFNGCIATTFFIGASNTANGGPGATAPNSSMFINYTVFDVCSQTYLVYAYGNETIAGSQFKVDQNLSSATLVTSVPLQDLVSGSILNIDLSLTWTATETASSGNAVNHFVAPGIRVNSHSHGTQRQAIATGKITVNGVELMLGSPEFATISKTSGGSVVIRK